MMVIIATSHLPNPLRSKMGRPSNMSKLKTWLRLVSMFKTPLVCLKRNTWKITEIKVNRHYFADILKP